MKHSIGRAEQPLYLTSITALEERFRTSVQAGLSSEEIKKRRTVHGPNAIPEIRPRFFLLVGKRLLSVLTILLLAAAGISALLHEYTNALVILVVVFFDVCIGITYELYSKHKIYYVKSKIQNIISVLRDGAIVHIPTTELVPGDICIVQSGQRVPADIRLTHVRGLSTNEHMLTGEAGDIEKTAQTLSAEAGVGDQRNMLFSGTTVLAGTGRGIVVAIGVHTMLGVLTEQMRIAGEQPAPLEARLKQLGTVFGIGLLSVAVFLFVLGVLQGIAPYDMFQTTLTLLVSAIPEDLTLLLTIALAIGAQRLLHRGGVVRHLAAAETLGDATVICSDKTGTLTTGVLSLARIEAATCMWAAGKEGWQPALRASHERLLSLVATASLAGTDILQDEERARVKTSSHEYALADAFRALRFSLPEIKRGYPLFDTLVFHPSVRYRASLHDDPVRAEPILFVVGAPDVLLPLSAASSNGEASVVMEKEMRLRLLEHVHEYASQGKRVLAVAQRHLEKSARSITSKDITHLTFLALLVFEDPLRVDAADAIRSFREAGVRTLLLTGDHRATAEHVARAVGITRGGEKVLVGSDIEQMSDDILQAELPRIAVIARVDPLQKERVVRALQKAGEIVGMIGDGVNDAIALRRADLGVAVESATDVAKDASDLVLLEEGIHTLHDAVREGRRIRETVRTVLAYLFSSNATELLAVFGALFLHLPLPFTPAMLLFMNVVTDGTTDVALALESSAARRGDALPGKTRGLFRADDVLLILSGAVALFLPIMLAYGVALVMWSDVFVARTIAFVAFAAAQVLAAFAFRSLRRFTWNLPLFGNPWLLLAVGGSLLLLWATVIFPVFQTSLGTVSLTSTQWSIAVVAALVGALLVEARKVLFMPWFRRPRAAHLKMKANSKDERVVYLHSNRLQVSDVVWNAAWKHVQEGKRETPHSDAVALRAHHRAQPSPRVETEDTSDVFRAQEGRIVPPR